MKKYLIILSVFNLYLATLFAQEQNIIKDPIQDYLFMHDFEKDFSLAEGQSLRILNLEMNYVKPVILMTMNGLGGQQGNIWTAYIPVNNGYIRAKDDNSDYGLIFRTSEFYVGLVDGQYGILSFLGGDGGGDLIFSQFINGSAITKKIKFLDSSNPKDQQEFENYFGKWKSLKNYPEKVLSLDDLRKAGYDVDLAIKEATKAGHPLPIASHIAIPSPSVSQSTSPQIQQSALNPSPTPIAKLETSQSFPWSWTIGVSFLLLGGVILFLLRKFGGR